MILNFHITILVSELNCPNSHIHTVRLIEYTLYNKDDYIQYHRPDP